MTTETIKFNIDASGAEAGARKIRAAIGNIKSALQSVDQSAEATFSTLAKQASGGGAFERLKRQGRQTFGDIEKVTIRAQNQFLTAERQAASLERRLGRLGDTKGIEEVRAATSRLNSELSSGVRSGKDIDRSVLQWRKSIQGARVRANNITTSFEKLHDRMGSVAGIGRSLRNVFGGITAALSVRRVVAYADSWTKVTNGVRLVTDSSQELAERTESLFRIAQDTRAAFEPTAALYSRLALSAKDLGIAQSDILIITKAVNQALAISGATSAESASAILQLSQAFNEGRLAGQEFNSVATAAPRLMQAIAAATGAPIGALRHMAADGKLTTEVLVDAFTTQSKVINEEFSQLGSTVGQALTRLDNAFLKLIGQFSNTTGASSGLAAGINLLADNLGTVASAAAFVAGTSVARWAFNAGSAVNKLLKRVGGASGAFSGLVKVLRFVPGLGIAATVAGIGTALFQARDSAVTFGDSTATVSQLAAEAFRRIQTAFSSVTDFFARASQSISNAVGSLIMRWNDWRAANSETVSAIVDTFRTLANVAIASGKSVVDIWVTGVRTIANAVFAAFEPIPALFDAIENRDFSKAAQALMDLNPLAVGRRIGTAVSTGFGEGFKSVKDNFNRDFVGDLGNEIEKFVAEASRNGTARGIMEGASQPIEPAPWGFELGRPGGGLVIGDDLLSRNREDVLAKLKKPSEELSQLGELSKDVGREIESELGDTFVRFAQTGKLSFRDLASDMLGQIAKLGASSVFQQVFGIFRGSAGGGGGFGGFATGVLGGLFKEGGISTDPAQMARVPTTAFVGAPRFQEGTPNSSGIPAILHENEAVIPLSRNRSVPVELKGAEGSGGGGINIVNNWNIKTDNADSFQRSRGMIEARIGQSIQRSMKRNT